MVESAGVAQGASGQVNIIVPNPTAARGKRAQIVFGGAEGKYLVYPSMSHLVFKGLDASVKDFVYNAHKTRITAVARTPDGKGYAFGDEAGAVMRFDDPSGKTDLELKSPLFMLAHEVNSIEWVQWANENKSKIIAVGNGTGAGKHAAVLGARAGTQAGDLLGSSGILLCSTVDAPADANAPVKLYSAGEVGEMFCHAGTPFKSDSGKSFDKLGCYVNGMAYSGEAKVLLVVTGDKRIVAYSGEDESKLATVDGAHGKGIYDVLWVSADTFLTCSADNLIKVWKWDATAKSIEEVEKIEQVPGAKEDIQKMLLALAHHGGTTAAVNLQYDLILRENGGQ